MVDRLIEVLVPDEHVPLVRHAIEENDVQWTWSQSADGTTVFKLLVPKGRIEPILDMLEPMIGAEPSARALVLPVEAVSPNDEGSTAGRISRSELYADLSGLAEVTPIFLVVTALSTIVATVGLARNSPAVIIGAMVIAPLLGPNMALSFGTITGDSRLILRSLWANFAGFLTAILVALLGCLFWSLDLGATEVSSRTEVSLGELTLALATGTAGALAVTSGVASSLVGVMVAVALLPPLVVAAMLMVEGQTERAAGAFLLLATNVICVNLSSVATFFIQGIRPRKISGQATARRATSIALTLWISLLALVAVLVTISHFLRQGSFFDRG